MKTCLSILQLKTTFLINVLSVYNKLLIVYYKRYQSLLKTILSIFRDSIE